jgi:hypothetical protein
LSYVLVFVSMTVTLAMEFLSQTKPLELLGNGRTAECLMIVLLITALIQLPCKGKCKVHSITGHEGPEESKV